MARFKLTTNDMFIKNNQKIQVITSGMDMSYFQERPTMLLGHNHEKILGTWTAINVEDDNISAIPNFDYDELSASIYRKVQKGSVKTASAGIDILEAYMQDDVLMITKSRLLEASLVAIPANPNAKIMEFGMKTTLTFSNNDGDVESFVKE